MSILTTIMKRGAIGAALLVVMAFVASLPIGGQRVPSIEAVGTCPLSFYLSGSTTWAPFTQAAAAPFQANWPGTTDNHSEIGSNNGLLDLDAIQPGGSPPNTHPNDVAVMSRAPVSTASTFEPGINGGDELYGNYWWQAAADAFVMGVQASWDSAHSHFLTSNGLTVSQLTYIYNAQGGITSLYWDDATLWSTSGRSVPAGAPHELVIPRMRITGGGSRTDFDKSVAVPDANENVTYTALGGDGGSYPRLVENADMADAAQSNPDQIAYTSLAQITSHPGMGIVPIAKTNAGPFLSPSVSNVNDNSYALPRQLWIGTHSIGVTSRDTATNPNASSQVRADDYVNYARSLAGQNLFSAVGFPTIPAASIPPIPDWDIDLNGSTSLGDIGKIVGAWGQQTNCNGWIRPDADNNGKVSLGDIGVLAQHWGQAGLQCDATGSNPNHCFHTGT